MCILSVFRGTSNLTLTFSRDEDPDREAGMPEIHGANRIFYPTDLRSGGTWIGKNDRYILCMQNGGKEKHIRQLPYELSRGIILKNVLETGSEPNPQNMIKGLKVEPFTLSALEFKSGRLFLFYYDGLQVEKQEILFDNLFINASSPLYNKENLSKIRSVLEAADPETPLELFELHERLKIGGEYNSLNVPFTVSITQFNVENGKVNCRYKDLFNKREQVFNSI